MMQDNLDRLQKEVSWFVEKNDYRNKDKDWGTSADSISAACRSAPAAIPPTRYSRQSSEHHVPPRRLLLFHGTAVSADGIYPLKRQ